MTQLKDIGFQDEIPLDNEVMHSTGNETIAGEKTFLNSLINNGSILFRNDGSSVMFFQKEDGTSRWALFKNDLQDFVLNRYDDSGAYLDSPLYISGSNGNVGIGTNNPTEKLQVNGNIKGNNLILIQNAIEESATNADTEIAFNYRSYNQTFNNFRNSSFYNGKGGLILGIVGSTGNVGIGTSNPNYKLDVNGAIGFTPGIGTTITPVDNGDIVFESTSNTSLVIKMKGSDGVIRSTTLTLA